jgi:galactokinase
VWLSLSSLYEVSCRELDIMAELAQQEPGCYGARMMGGGFGGAVIALVAESEVAGVAARVLLAYRAALVGQGLRPSAYIAKAGPGSAAVAVG